MKFLGNYLSATGIHCIGSGGHGHIAFFLISPFSDSRAFTTKPNCTNTILVRDTSLLTTDLPSQYSYTRGSTEASRIGIRRKPSLAAVVCDELDGFVNAFMEGPLRPHMDPAFVFSGNFAPVGELPPVDCPVVKGRIPSHLVGGAYIRNGPNQQHVTLGPHHLFDGDGMLHSLLLSSSGTAKFCSRFVRTYRFRIESEAGGPVLPRVFGGLSGLSGLARIAISAARVITGQWNPNEGVGLANTGLVYMGNRLMALGESDLPYAVHLSPIDGDITTIGRLDFDGTLSGSMTAHPKKDPVTGEVFAFRYGPFPPFLTYFWFDRDGRKQTDVPVFGMTRPSFVHDFAVTATHAVFVDIQITIRFGEGSGVDGEKVPRIGVMPRYPKSGDEMRWFDTPGFNMVHTVNAWDEEDGDVVVLVAPNLLTVEHALKRIELSQFRLEMVRIDLHDGTVTRQPLSDLNLDFPVINPSYLGRKNRYAYIGIGDPLPKISGVVKLDYGSDAVTRGECVVARGMFGPGCFGGEPFFVPSSSDSSSEEDDGYLLSYVHDEGQDESKFAVMDARSPVLETVAEVLLPRRVPYGFHGLFVTETELKRQELA